MVSITICKTKKFRCIQKRIFCIQKGYGFVLFLDKILKQNQNIMYTNLNIYYTINSLKNTICMLW